MLAKWIYKCIDPDPDNVIPRLQVIQITWIYVYEWICLCMIQWTLLRIVIITGLSIVIIVHG